LVKNIALKRSFPVAAALCALLTGAFFVSSRTAAQTPTPSPTVRPVTTPTPLPLQTIADLQAKIASRMMSPEARRARVGVKIVSLNSGKVVFESDAEKYFIPASNMKNFTVAAALEALGPDFKFVTSVYSSTAPDSSGTIKDDLRIVGRGDVSFSTLFSKIVAAGVKRIEGSLVADESYFKGNPIPATWEWDDLQWYDGAEVSAFPINNNALDLTVKGGSPGGPCLITLLPVNTLYRITNTCTTTSSGTKRGGLVVKKSLEQNSVVISGTMAAGDAFTGYITFAHPADLFVALLKERLEKKGVVITGGSRSLPKEATIAQPQVEILRLESPPFRDIIQKTMKPSQNMFTEVILWTMGEATHPLPDYVSIPGAIRPAPTRPDSSALGLQKVKEFLTTTGIPADSVVQYDGSGLSRHDLVTPSSIVQLYLYMAKQSRNSQVWRNSLTIGGIDGTLRNRFKGTAAAGNIRGKTGTLDQVSALSGYLTTVGGEQLVVSVMVNGMPTPSQRTSLIDDIVVGLANFNGKIDQ
jgi:D-alanyl-D-alanine carboxypeptidase/D-alanyl-D-alanine-endopeptidase (penicillin-binding protein 4)